MVRKVVHNLVVVQPDARIDAENVPHVIYRAPVKVPVSFLNVNNGRTVRDESSLIILPCSAVVWTQPRFSKLFIRTDFSMSVAKRTRSSGRAILRYFIRHFGNKHSGNSSL